MLLSKSLSYYKKPKVRQKLVEFAKDKEIAIQFTNFFGKRPDVLLYENDVLDLAKRKATSFHCSEELWTNPLSLRSDIKPKEMNELRKGWDLILDIDCAHFVYSKLATYYLIQILKEEGLDAITCKFSGNKGFHIAVPWEAFPKIFNKQDTANLFPEAPRKIAAYLKEKLEPLLEKSILKLEKNDISNISKRTNLPYKELVEDNKLLIDKFLEIDTILIAPRHLYRMPYSLHEKSGLVSLPVNINKVHKFTKSQANPDIIEFNNGFLDRNVTSDQATKLLIKAYDFDANLEKSSNNKFNSKKEFEIPENAVSKDHFPPCIKNILSGLTDGKKRALFTLANFLKGCGYSFENIKQEIYEWNERNPEPLKEVYLKGQLNQLKKSKEVVPPHNCPRSGTTYYKDLQVCNPDSFCSKIKNPLQYATLKHALSQKKKSGRPKLTEKQKEMRRKHRAKKNSQD